MLSTYAFLILGSLLAPAFAAPYDRQPSTADAPALPKSDLPAPDGLNLKAITVGVGHQNYTCNSTSGTYSSNVALAGLFDATQYLSKHPDRLDRISKERLEQFIDSGECPEESDYRPHLRRVGEHYFEPTTPVIPDFDLEKFGLFLEAKKVDGVPAPDTANDIDWLYLVDNGKGETNGLKAVYRVETAGGKPPASCTGDEKVFVPYAAQYWFYD